MRADRLISLLLLLQARDATPAPVLAERLEVSVRTVLRDVDALSTAGIPVYAERGRSGGIRLALGYRSGLGGLSPSEASSLMLGHRRLASDLGLPDALDLALAKLGGALSGGARQKSEQTRRLVLVDLDKWRGRAEPVPHLPALHEALVARRTVSIEYQRDGREASEAHLTPLGLVAKAGVWYLLARPLTETRSAVFRVARVSSVTTRPQTFALDPTFDLEQAWAEALAHFEIRDPLRVEVAVVPGAEAMARRLVGPQVAGVAESTLADGRLLLTVGFGGAEHAAGVLMGLGIRVEVLRPASVRTLLAAQATAVAALYSRASTG